MNSLPDRFDEMLKHGLSFVKNKKERDELFPVAQTIATAVWQHWLKWRPKEDNRPEHEFVVFANVMRIAKDVFSEEDKKTRLSKLRVATAFAFTHDTYSISRVTETVTDEVASSQARVQMQNEKLVQRLEHMKGGADNANFLLKRLKHPQTSANLLKKTEIDLCVKIIKRHDSWKLDPPDLWVPSIQRGELLAVVCLEADALWPLHPLGVLADLERPKANRNLFLKKHWRKELKGSLHTLQGRYRSNWVDYLPGTEKFQDDVSIFRTKAGYNLYLELLDLWNWR